LASLVLSLVPGGICSGGCVGRVPRREFIISEVNTCGKGSRCCEFFNGDVDCADAAAHLKKTNSCAEKCQIKSRDQIVAGLFTLERRGHVADAQEYLIGGASSAINIRKGWISPVPISSLNFASGYPFRVKFYYCRCRIKYPTWSFSSHFRARQTITGSHAQSNRAAASVRTLRQRPRW
jgi:hypothetical protein